MKASLAFVLVLAGLAALACRVDAAPAKTPNILFIVMDDVAPTS